MTINDDQEDVAAPPEREAQDPTVTDGKSEPEDIPADDSAIRGQAEHTAERPENQDGTPPSSGPSGQAAQPTEGLDGRLQKRVDFIQDLLSDKEALQLAFVFKRAPKPYYEQWKSESNELVSLLIGLHNRAKALRRKAG